MSLSSIGPKERTTFKLGENISGLVIKSLDPQSLAAQRGVRKGDVIVEANQVPLSSPRQFSEILNLLKKGSKKTVLLMIDRKGDRRFVGIRLDQ